MYYAHNDINFNIKDAMYSDPSGYPEIGNDVWIGRDVTMKMGVKIGDGAILAAQSVVTKNVEPFTVVAGNPAKPIKKRFDDATIESLINSNIFGYNLVDLAAHNIIDYKLPKYAAEKITELSGLGKISLYTPKKLKLLAI